MIKHSITNPVCEIRLNIKIERESKIVCTIIEKVVSKSKENRKKLILQLVIVII